MGVYDLASSELVDSFGQHNANNHIRAGFCDRTYSVTRIFSSKLRRVAYKFDAQSTRQSACALLHNSAFFEATNAIYALSI
jgi:hypothetical protein